MASSAVTTGGVEGRTGAYEVTAFRLVVLAPKRLTRFAGVGGDGTEHPEWKDCAPYLNVFSSREAFEASPLAGDVAANVPLSFHEPHDPFGDDPTAFYIEFEMAPVDIDTGVHYIVLHMDRTKGSFAWRETTVDLGSDLRATSASPGESESWESIGYDPGTVAIDVYGLDGGGTCPADLDGNGVVEVADLVDLLQAWGPCPDHCPADLDGDDVVDTADLNLLLAAWGPCG
jgi:hypothetical protein